MLLKCRLRQFARCTVHQDPAAPQLTYSIPSSALLRADNAYVFGELAESEKTVTPEGYQREFKRDLGSSIPYRLRDKQVSAAELSAKFLTFLAELTTTTLTTAPATTVITVPAAYDQFRRSLIDDAARRAGLAGASLVGQACRRGHQRGQPRRSSPTAQPYLSTTSGAERSTPPL